MSFKKLNIVRLGLLLMTLFTIQLVSADSSVRYEFVDSSRSIMRAAPNQTLSMLVQQIYPKYKDIWPQIEREIRERNPRAFNRYTGRVIPGVRMKLVTIKVIRKGLVSYKSVVGKVSSVKGSAFVTDTRGNDRTLTEDADLFEGDRLTTEDATTLVVKMVDGAEMHIKPDSSVRLTQYVLKSGFEPGSSSIIDLIRGGLRKVTGSIGANPLSTYRFHTGVITIGVRGTDYVVKLCEENDCEVTTGRNDSKSRLHVVVLDGLISLEDEEGSVGELIMGQYAVATADTKVMVNDAGPVNGLLSHEERTIYNELKSQAQEAKAEKSIWPWILGGALLGL